MGGKRQEENKKGELVEEEKGGEVSLYIYIHIYIYICMYIKD